MTGIIIGSTAIKHWFPEFRDPKDYDVFSDENVPGAEVFWHPLLGEHQWRRPGIHRTDGLWYASPNEMYTLKVSHAYWELKNGSWDKHMSDLVFLKDNGATLIQPLHDLLRKVWTETHGRKKVNLSMESGTFFKDAVKRQYDHDSLHASVAYGPEPMYIRYLKPGHSVAMDMEQVWASSFDDLVRLFREEVYATALERLVIPSNYTCSPRGAYAWALRRTITSLTKGKSAQFLVENFKLFRSPDCDYVARHRANQHLLIPLEV